MMPPLLAARAATRKGVMMTCNGDMVVLSVLAAGSAGPFLTGEQAGQEAATQADGEAVTSAAPGAFPVPLNRLQADETGSPDDP
jgi:hypothetical protein